MDLKKIFDRKPVSIPRVINPLPESNIPSIEERVALIEAVLIESLVSDNES